MADLIIPMSNDSKSLFAIDLDGNTYEIDIHWNGTEGYWYMHLNGVTNDVALNGIKLASGQDLLVPFAELELGSIYMVDETDQERDADFDTLGVDVKMYYVEKETT